ncbi:MAG: hypothetical protein KDA93_23275 [Planctomycetaceae bacterium]|nr:hypothetical protein [Planctomycetaceae bacterium]
MKIRNLKSVTFNRRNIGPFPIDPVFRFLTQNACHGMGQNACEQREFSSVALTASEVNIRMDDVTSTHRDHDGILHGG